MTHFSHLLLARLSQWCMRLRHSCVVERAEAVTVRVAVGMNVMLKKIAQVPAVIAEKPQLVIKEQLKT